MQCKREVKVDKPYQVDPHYGGPEYETIASLGSLCGITDLIAISKGSELANGYGLDSISCGAVIAFAMECYEKGLLKAKDSGGIDLRFGNGAAMVQMIEQIALREGLGDLLAEGVARAAKKVGSAAEEFAFHIKGQEFPMQEPRWKQGMGIGYSVSPTGADHCHNMHDDLYASMTPILQELNNLGHFEPLPLDDLSPAKVQILIHNSILIHFLNCGVCCYFIMSYGLTGFKRIAQLVTAVTGWNTTIADFMKVGERAINSARVFNLREGFTCKDDNMPQRFFKSQASGPLQGVALDPVTFKKAIETYYDMMGWPGGSPSSEKLRELGLEWAIASFNMSTGI